MRTRNDLEQLPEHICDAGRGCLRSMPLVLALLLLLTLAVETARC